MHPPRSSPLADTSFDDPLSYTILQGTALNSFLYKALLDASYVGAVLNETQLAANYSASAASLGAAINSILWNETAGTYNSGINNSATGEVVVFDPTVHATMIALQRGIVPAERAASVVAWFLEYFQRIGGFHCCTNPDYEVRDLGTWLGLYLRIIELSVSQAMIAERAGINMTVSYYWAFQVLYGLDTPAGDALALSEMRRQWGNMLLATDIDTLWESFADSESCHNYGAVPAYFLSAYLLGVRIAGPVWEPGALRIEPRLGGLPAVSGAVVTELGVVNCAWSLNSTALTFSVTLPSATGAVPLRLAGMNGSTLVINGVATPTTSDGRYAVAVLPGPGNFAGSIGVAS